MFKMPEKFFVYLAYQTAEDALFFIAQRFFVYAAVVERRGFKQKINVHQFVPFLVFRDEKSAARTFRGA